MELIQTEYTYTKDFARRATSRFFWRYSRRALVLVVLVTGTGIVRLLNGWTDWFTLVCLMFPFMYLTIWYSHLRRSAKVVSVLRDPTMTFVADENGLTLRNIDHVGSMTWSGVKEVWEFPELWLLFPYGVGASYTAVSTAVLPEQTRHMMLAKLRENGARIVG